MDSIAFNIVSVLNQEIETLQLSRTEKDDIEYQIVLRWLNNRVRKLEND